MSTLPEQFSAARNTQVEAQLEMFRKFSSKAVENTQKLVALNINTTRVSLEKSTEAMRQLLLVRDPRDLFALTTQTQQNIETMVAYGRALMGIATGAVTELPKLATAASAAVPVQVTVEATPAPAAEPEPATPHLAVVPAMSTEDREEEATLATAEPETPVKPAAVLAAVESAVPAAKAKPIAKAVSKVVAKEAAAKPAAAPIEDASPVEVKSVKPVEAAPAPAPVSGKPVIPASKSTKKK